MPFLVYIRNSLSADGASAKIVFDEAGGAPVLEEADRRAGLLDKHRISAAEADTLKLKKLCQSYPRTASQQGAA